MKNKKNKNILYHALFLFFLVGGIVFAYKGMFRTFYQQDEWRTLGQVFSDGIFGGIQGIPFILLLSGYWRLFGSIANNIMYARFPFQAMPIAVWAITFHSINSILVYMLVLKIFRKTLPASVTALFFAFGFVHSQAVSWFASVFTTLPNFTFVLLSILFLFMWKDTKKNRFLWLSEISCVIAYFFKESSLFLFFLLPVIFVALKPKNMSVFESIRKFWILIFYGIFVVFMRMTALSGLGNDAGLFVSNSPFMMAKTLLHVVFYPIISLSQMYLTPKILFGLSNSFLSLFYGWQTVIPVPQTVSELIVPDLLSVFFSFVLLCCSLGLFAVKNKTLRNLLFWGFVFTCLSFLPFAVLDRSVSYLDSRYFYIGMAGGGLILSVWMESIILFCRRRLHVPNLVMTVGLVGCLGIFSYKNIQFIRRDIALQEAVSAERITFLADLNTASENIPEKPVFYVTGDNLGYYYIPDLKVPFQQGVWVYAYGLVLWKRSHSEISSFGRFFMGRFRGGV